MHLTLNRRHFMGLMGAAYGDRGHEPDHRLGPVCHC